MQNFKSQTFKIYSLKGAMRGVERTKQRDREGGLKSLALKISFIFLRKTRTTNHFSHTRTKFHHKLIYLQNHFQSNSLNTLGEEKLL